MAIITDPSILDRHNRTTSDDKGKLDAGNTHSKAFRIRFMVLLILCHFFFAWLEDLPVTFLAVLVVKDLGWPNQHGALVTVVYMGGHSLARCIGIPLSTKLKPQAMIVLDLCLTIAGYILMLFTFYHSFIMWLAAALVGFGVGTYFATSLLWVEEYIPVSGRTAAVVMATNSVGRMLSPLLCSALIERYGTIGFSTLLVCITCIEMTSFVSLVTYAQKYGTHRFKVNNRTNLPATFDISKSGDIQDSHDMVVEDRL